MYTLERGVVIDGVVGYYGQHTFAVEYIDSCAGATIEAQTVDEIVFDTGESQSLEVEIDAFEDSVSVQLG